MAVSLQTLIDRSVKNMGSGINPRVKEYAVELIRRAYAEGIYVQISSGYRSNAEQQKLYNQGRTTPGKIVTNARPGQSVHNYGLAIDFFLVSDDGNTALWTVNHKWKRVAAIGKSIGFQWGGDWKSFPDYPHLDMQKGLSLAQLAAGKRPTIPALSKVIPVSNPVEDKGYLHEGDSGPAVGQLQKDLNQAGANPQLVIDNRFGIAVKNRVITFQKQNGLEADGIYGAASVAKMKAVLGQLAKASAKKEEAKVTKPREVSKDHAVAWDWAKQKGYLNGEKPGEPLSREQFATVLKRVEEEKERVHLSDAQRKEYSTIFKLAREKGIFESAEHEQSILDGTMKKSRLEYLQLVIAAATLNDGMRV